MSAPSTLEKNERCEAAEDSRARADEYAHCAGIARDAVAEAFIRNGVLAASLPGSVLCAELLAQCGIVSELVAGWLICDGSRATRHIWLRAGGREFDPGVRVAAAVHKGPALRLERVASKPRGVRIDGHTTARDRLVAKRLERGIDLVLGASEFASYWATVKCLEIHQIRDTLLSVR